MKLLQRAIQARTERNERERLNVRERLRAALGECLPVGSRVWLYGSLVKPGRFAETSDIDLALEKEPEGQSIYGLLVRLAERTGREVDLTLLSETRLCEAIQREGELWTL